MLGFGFVFAGGGSRFVVLLWEVMPSHSGPSTESALEAGFHQQVGGHDKCQFPLFIIHNFYVYIYVYIYI